MVTWLHVWFEHGCVNYVSAYVVAVTLSMSLLSRRCLMFQTRRSNFQSQLKQKAKIKKSKLEIVAPFEGFGRF
jgi:hypothetical protein